MAKAKKKGTQEPLRMVYMVPCDSVSKDPNTGKATLYGLFDKIWLENIPGVIPRFSVFAKLDGLGKFPVIVEVVDPKGKIIESSKLDLEVKKDGFAILHMDFGNVDVRKAGDVEIRIMSGRRMVGNARIPVAKKKQARSPRKKRG